MPGRGRRKAELRLTAAERAELVRAVRAAESWQNYVLRCRIVLASADGATDMRIAQDLGISMPTVGKWRSRSGPRASTGSSTPPGPDEGR